MVRKIDALKDENKPTAELKNTDGMKEGLFELRFGEEGCWWIEKGRGGIDGTERWWIERKIEAKERVVRGQEARRP